MIGPLIYILLVWRGITISISPILHAPFQKWLVEVGFYNIDEVGGLSLRRVTRFRDKYISPSILPDHKSVVVLKYAKTYIIVFHLSRFLI